MTSKEETNSSEELTTVVDLLEKNLKYLTAIGISEGALRSYHKVVIYLRSCSGAEVNRIFGQRSRVSSKKMLDEFALTDDEIRELDLVRVKAYLIDPKLPRISLERIASIRFGMTKGAISSLGNRRALIDKVQTLIDHEGTHEVISRAAVGKPD